MRRTAATTVALAAAALVLSACSAGDDTEAATASTPTVAVEETPTPTPTPIPEPEQTEEPPAETPAVEPEPVEVPASLAFTATTVDGQSFEGATLAGQDSVLYFWAPWCTVCRAEAPSLPALASDFEGDATFYGVAGLSPDVDAMQGFVNDTGTQSLTHIADTDGTIYTGFGVSSQTTFAFINDDGTIEIVRGPLSPDEVRTKTQALIDS
ncbi:MAG: redoxin domain-containing protein [Jiangellales bacterium]